MKKYVFAAIPMFVGNEIISLACLSVIAVFFLIDLAKASPEWGERE